MKNVWIFSFECAGIVKVGGLGEAVYNITKHLANRGFNVTLFMPSHGIHKKPEARKRLNLQDSNITIKGSLKGNNFLPYRSPFKYKIGALNGFLQGFKVTLFYGLNKATSEILDDAMVYSANKIEDKALLLARGTSGYIEHLKDTKQNFPDIIHAHDYHAIPAAVSGKQKLETYNHKTAFVLTIHLLSGKKVSWNYLGENWCGIENKLHPVYLSNRRTEMFHREILKRAKLKLESFGAIEAQMLTSVSQNYLQDEVICRIGLGCEGKTAFHWNGCDWDFNLMLKETLTKFGDDIRKLLGVTEIQRYDLRKYFLTKGIGNLKPEEPILEDGKIKETIYSLKEKPFIGDGKIEPFSEDGPMVLMTGRLTEQKGVDILFKAVPNVLEKIPNAKFILLLLPLEEELNFISKSAKLTSKYKRSVRIIFGKATSIYSLAHLASDIFVCPSKWEPFGIMALEAMATGNPVVATKVGGLKEIIIDISQDLENGTGILIPKNDHEALADAISSLLTASQISEILQKESRIQQEALKKSANSISNESLREAIFRQPSYGQKLRENAIRRVEETFRWSKVINMVIDAYEKAADTMSFVV